MTAPNQCANCQAPLPADEAADNAYCVTCTAAWTRGPAAQDAGDVGDGAASGNRCANCQAPLPADQPADNAYCATCTAAWTRG